jgi:hypothetical protein
MFNREFLWGPGLSSNIVYNAFLWFAITRFL